MSEEESKTPNANADSSDWRDKLAEIWAAFAANKRRLWGSAAGLALVVGLLTWLALRPNAYVDGVDVRQDPDWAQLRDFVWEVPALASPELNASEDHYDPTVSADHLALVFVKGRPGEGADLWIMDWNGSAWENARPIEALNSERSEVGPNLSPDGKLLYFSSDREGGHGGFDLWASRRGPEGEWGEPLNLGPNLNTPYQEYDPSFHAFSGRLFFTSNRPDRELTLEEKDAWKGTLRELRFEEDFDLFAANPASLSEDVPEVPAFEPAEREYSLNSPSNEGQLSLTARGDFLYFTSDREEGEGGYDLYRARIFQGEIQKPENLGRPVNTPSDEMDPALAMEGHRLLFSSNRGEAARPSGVPSFALYHTVSREVAPMRIDEESSSGLWSFLYRMKWWILLLLAGIAALYCLMLKWAQAGKMGEAGLRTRCFIGSVLFHVVLALLFSLKQLVEEVIEMKQAEVMEANLEVDALAMEKEALDIREETTELPQVEDTPEPDFQQRFTPTNEAPEQPEELSTPQEIEDAFVVENASATPLEVPPPDVPVPEREEQLNSPEARPLQPLAFTMANLRLETSGPVEAEAEPQFREPNEEAQASRRSDSPLENTKEVAEKADTPNLSDEAEFAESSAVEQIDASEALPLQDEQDQLAESRPTHLRPAETAPASPDVVLEQNRQVEQGDDAPAVNPPSSDSSVAKAAAFRPEPSDENSPEQAEAEIKGGEAARAESVLKTVEAPRQASEEADELEDVSNSPLSDSNSSAPDALALKLEGRSQLEKGEDAPDLQTPSIDESVAQAASFSNPEGVDAQSPQKDEREIRGGAGLASESAVSETQAPQAESGETKDDLADVENLALSPDGASEAKASDLKLEADRRLEAEGAGPEVKAPETDVSVAKASELRTPDLGDEEADRSHASIQDAALENISAATEAGVPDASPADAPLKDALAPFRNEPKPLVGGPKLGDLTHNLSLENTRDLEGGPAEAEISNLTEDSGVGSFAAFREEKTEPHSSSTGIVAPTGLKPTGSAVLNLPKLNFGGLPNLGEPKNLANPVRLRLPLSGASPKLALESKPATDQPFLLRDPDQRARVLERLGGTQESELAVSRALDWFSRNQERDGRWSIKRHGGQQGHDVAATSFALLCYFGWGAKHNDGGPYRETVDKALRWLVEQMKEDGDLTAGQHNGMYDHGVASLALAEAYGLSKDPAMREPLERAVAFVVKAQNQSHGAWDYRPGGKRIDTSVSGWQLMALKSARIAGIEISERPFDLSGVWLDRVAAGPQKGIYGYDRAGHKTAAMVAEGMFSQQLLDKFPAEHPRMKESADYLRGKLPRSKDRNNDFYYWYYGTLASYMNKGELWKEWNPVMRDMLLERQVKNGRDEGSWEYKGGNHSGQMGRVVATAMATLSLEVYYRYLPSAKKGSAEIPRS